MLLCVRGRSNFLLTSLIGMQICLLVKPMLQNYSRGPLRGINPSRGLLLSGLVDLFSGSLEGMEVMVTEMPTRKGQGLNSMEEPASAASASAGTLFA